MSKFLVVIAAVFGFAVSAYGAEQVVDCPIKNYKNNIFDSSVLERMSVISIGKGSEEYPIVLDFYRRTGGGCKKNEFARYRVEGGLPAVESIFFLSLRGRVNVFAIVSWDINHRGDGSYGRLYQVRAYQFNDGGVLVENNQVSEDGSMTGIDGYVGGGKSRFEYKNVSSVKKYWRRVSR
ncbi:hypothetical protein RVV79_002387 [Burkholderia contaminans]|nr:hypothetical protein [Burkholderia contaminans]